MSEKKDFKQRKNDLKEKNYTIEKRTPENRVWQPFFDRFILFFYLVEKRTPENIL